MTLPLTGVEFELFESLAGLPQFNPDLDTDTPPEAVEAFRRQLRDADGVLICTPEYAMGVPGSLKNALDWTVSSSDFSHKPVALITASSLGNKGHAALLETLRVIEAHLEEKALLVISFIRSKMSKDGTITDTETEKKIREVVLALGNMMLADHASGQ
jgi:NAD(P)H-dependent FMN reductase